MKSLQNAIVLLFAFSLLMTAGCFSYHSTKEVAEPGTSAPSETTTTTTTHSDNGVVQQRSTTTNTYPTY
ncbi:MAG: hypothetical protein JO189_18075 [Deltaproteobacteria bacterium]|nr:hypothetical protein [Deltaproteobacteria bacterium]